MAIIKIEEVYLYVTEATDNAAENIEANSYMDHSGIPYTRMFYNDASAVTEVLNSVNTWWQLPPNELPPATKFPLLTYVEVHDDIPARYSPVKYLEGAAAIKTFAEIYNSVNK